MKICKMKSHPALNSNHNSIILQWLQENGLKRTCWSTPSSLKEMRNTIHCYSKRKIRRGMNHPIVLFESLPIVQPRQEPNYIEHKQFDRLPRSTGSFGKSYSHYLYSILYEIL